MFLDSVAGNPELSFARLVSGASPGFQTAAGSLCPHMTLPLYSQGERTGRRQGKESTVSSYKDTSLFSYSVASLALITHKPIYRWSHTRD